ncbi:kinase [Luteimonas sp. MC1782]|uniref:kinase n=1 Tax=Luteimonas sp. MC1782 TaxID=2760305 RepID=UPI0015FEC0C3|nr:kinase [Luteimonas sp. MC1782]MBB1472755.1 kinase [Luteimonas sp. MC1782]
MVAAVLAEVIASGARVFAISGVQGSGKSTLAAQLARAAAARGLPTAVLSIDDVYLDHDARQALARDVHPLLATRGPPGTHDLSLAFATLDALRATGMADLPRFDKLADRRCPRSDWPRVAGIRLVILEGWFIGTTAEDDAALATPVNALERDEDPDATWRRWCNAALARDYPALWARADRLLFLQPPGFEVVADWRWQAEQALHAAAPSRPAMTRAGIERFIQHYERVSRQALRTLPAIADLVVGLDAARRPTTDAPVPTRRRTSPAG